MKYLISRLTIFTGLFCIVSGLLSCSNNPGNQTAVSINGEQFFINNEVTYKGRYWNKHKIEGLLLNSRMVQGVFDDENPATKERFAYPDSKVWDADRNTDEFIEAMPIWYAHGLLSFTINMQGGSPLGYGNHGWINTAFDSTGNIKSNYKLRLEKILDKADEIGMVPILGLFYFGQDEYLKDEEAVINGVKNTVNWLLEKGYKNILIEINNECDVRYDHSILQPERVHELIDLVKSIQKDGQRLLVSTSYRGGFIPKPNVINSSDFILLHGNGVHHPDSIAAMVEKTRAVEGYRNQPIVFNEDDHYDFDKDSNNFTAAISGYASWGYFDYRHEGEGFESGFQSVPVDWQINSERKKAFFNKLKEITGK